MAHKFGLDEPAVSIRDVVEHLMQEDRQGTFLYRGQPREYPGPLLPSLYRHYERTGRTYRAHDPEYEYSLRKSGAAFVDLNPISGWFSSQSIDPIVTSQEAVRRASYKALELLLTDPLCDTAAISGNLSEFFSERLHLNDQASLDLLAESMRQVAETSHRRYIRDVVFSLPLGKLLGTTVAQQYGFSSGYLDVTTSVRVAAFFATHQAPAYHPISGNKALGIIYRFPRAASSTWSKQEVMTRRLASLPPSVVIEAGAAPFEGNSPDYSACIRKYTEYALDSLQTADPLWEEYFTLPRGWLKYSRLGRQGAAVLIPDRIMKPLAENPEPVWWQHSDWVIAELLAIEDLTSRPHAEKYYFRHSPNEAKELGLNREYLWPRDSDFFLMVTKSLLLLGADVGTQYPNTGYLLRRIPNRPDLVDPGYKDEGGSEDSDD